FVGVQELDHAAVERGDAASRRFCRGKSIDYASRLGDFFDAWRKRFVGRRDLVGMDQGLAGKAEIAPVLARCGKGFDILELRRDRIERIETMRARRQDTKLQ